MNDISGQFILDGRTNSSAGSGTRGPNIDPIKLARQLARPVALGMISENRADVELMLASLRAHSAGQISCDPLDYAKLLMGILRECKRRFSDLRENAGGAVRGAAAPLIKIRTPLRRVFAESHNANADHGFLLREEEVNEIVALQVASFLQPADKGAAE